VLQGVGLAVQDQETFHLKTHANKPKTDHVISDLHPISTTSVSGTQIWQHTVPFWRSWNDAFLRTYSEIEWSVTVRRFGNESPIWSSLSTD